MKHGEISDWYYKMDKVGIRQTLKNDSRFFSDSCPFWLSGMKLVKESSGKVQVAQQPVQKSQPVKPEPKKKRYFYFF